MHGPHFTTDTRDGEVGSEPLFSDLGFANRASTLVRDAFKIQNYLSYGASQYLWNV